VGADKRAVDLGKAADRMAGIGQGAAAAFLTAVVQVEDLAGESTDPGQTIVLGRVAGKLAGRAAA
jgi:hypothetical protein